MGKIIEFKPKNTKDRRTSGTATIIEFPNVNEYIQLYEKVLNNRKDKESIYEAFSKVNIIVSHLNNPLEKREQIFRFINYFINSVDEDFLNSMQEELKDEDLEIFDICTYINEEEIIDSGMELIDEIDEEFVDILKKVSSYICFKIKNETLIEYVSSDHRITYDIDLEPREYELLTDRKAELMFSLLIRSHINGGVFFIHEWKNEKDYLSGLIVNPEGIFTISKKDLQKNFKGNQNIVYTELQIKDLFL